MGDADGPLGFHFDAGNLGGRDALAVGQLLADCFEERPNLGHGGRGNRFRHDGVLVVSFVCCVLFVNKGFNACNNQEPTDIERF